VKCKDVFCTFLRVTNLDFIHSVLQADFSGEKLYVGGSSSYPLCIFINIFLDCKTNSEILTILQILQIYTNNRIYRMMHKNEERTHWQNFKKVKVKSFLLMQSCLGVYKSPFFFGRSVPCAQDVKTREQTCESVLFCTYLLLSQERVCACCFHHSSLMWTILCHLRFTGECCVLYYVGIHKFSNIWEPPPNSACQKGDMKYLPYRGPTIRQ
jgi:hypothetical protein